MKKRITALFLLLLLACALSAPAFAETIDSSDWQVTFTEKGKIVSNFDASSFIDTRSGMQPGDTLNIRVRLKNEYAKKIDWYMKNEVLRSLENETAKGGGYAYELRYTYPDGHTDKLFSSARVGGEDIQGGREGLREATDSLEDYFYLDTVGKGRVSYVELTVTLDGETQGNRYQRKSENDYADLTMRFAAEVTNTKVVKTDDQMNLLPLYLLMTVSGLVFLYLALDAYTDRLFSKRRGKG